MKKFIGAAFIAILMVSMVPGVSTAFASDGAKENETPVSIVITSANVTTRQVYSVTDSLMNELDRLVKMLGEAESKGDKELIAAIMEKIRSIKAEIERINTQTSSTTTTVSPVVISQPVEPRVTEIKPVPATGSNTQITVSTTADRCSELEAVEKKLDYYETLYSLSDDELKAKGYTRGREEIEKIIIELKGMVSRLREECKAGTVNSTVSVEPEKVRETSNAGTTGVIMLAPPIAVQSGGEITDYYKRRIAEIATEETGVNDKIAVLKELRNEIDSLIEELIKGKDSISTSEVKGLVEKIQVKPGEVRMDEVIVTTTDKKVTARISDRDLEIKPTSGSVIINDGNIEVNAQEISIENEILKVGNSEVKMMPSMAVMNMNTTPTEIALVEENNQAVYKIKTEEQRKLLGFIPMKVKNTITINAANTNGEITKEQRPWWAFLTTAGQ